MCVNIVSIYVKHSTLIFKIPSCVLVVVFLTTELLFQCWTREVCEVLCAQLEVWWEVAPVRFVLDPPVLPLTHSRR